MATMGNPQRAFLICLSLMIALTACERKYPNGPPLREVETEEDKLFMLCLGGGIYTADPQCRRFVSGREK